MKVSDISVEYLNHCGSDLDVVNAARVSFNKESVWKIAEDGWSDIGLYEKDERLIKYLAKHKHYSPFNHTFVSVRVKAPIFIARQLVKHEYMPWNEVSRRYVDDGLEFYSPDDWHYRAENVKQGAGDNLSVEDHLKADAILKFATKMAIDSYDKLLDLGVAPEEARIVLPLNLQTEWIWSGTLKAFAKMLHLRLDSHTQAETRIVAEKIKEIITPIFPVSLPALLESDLVN